MKTQTLLGPGRHREPMPRSFRFRIVGNSVENHLFPYCWGDLPVTRENNRNARSSDGFWRLRDTNGVANS
jgi:hypothetical protein